MTDRYLHHVTLSTGHTRRSYREEVTEEALAVVSDLLARALAGERVVLPVLDPPCHLTADTRGGTSLVAYVSLDATDERLVTVGVASRSTAGASHWRWLHEHRVTETQPVKTDAERCPPEPWCAARLEPGIGTVRAAQVPQLMMAIADLERVLAWAWIARTEH